MSSVQDRKFYSILKRIPVETTLEVLKFLTYEQWFALQFSNWRLANIIKKNVNYLAFPKFRWIGFYVRVKYLMAFNSKYQLALSRSILHPFKKYNIRWVYSKGWGFGRERKCNNERYSFCLIKEISLKIKLLWINNFQSDLTEAFSKLNQVPLARFRFENSENNFLYIYIGTGKCFILLPFIFI
jgi:hypothetical protein